MTVRIVCAVKGCNRTLKTLDTPPDPGHEAWTDRHRGVWVESCLKHGGVPTTLDETRARRAERGMPDVDRSKLLHFVPWADLREDFERSSATHRTVTRGIEPLQRRL